MRGGARHGRHLPKPRSNVDGGRARLAERDQLGRTWTPPPPTAPPGTATEVPGDTGVTAGALRR